MPVPTSVKKALLVGIQYSANENLMQHGFPEQPGAHKDTDRLHKLLTTKYGYKDEDIVILIDSDSCPKQPTRDNILDEIKKLVEGRQRGDHIVFAFSGHGSQVDAILDQNEADGRDEVLMPIDCTFEPETSAEPLNFIRDDIIRQYLVDELPDGVRCTMVFDCCHSGTASDLPSVPESAVSPISPLASTRLPSRAFARMETVQSESAPVPYVWPSNLANIYPPNMGASVAVEKKKDVTAWSACLDDQVTFGRKSGGIFIKAFANALTKNPTPTHSNLLKLLTKEIELDTNKANQQRQAKGNDETPYVAPRPQLGSLQPRAILHDIFML
ncbi:peptidase C14, caspase domain-containing protein [Fomes fomentarius]|nr:peptidase C14, caspase domain-containing protein [Fomes fomentarius]